MRIGLPFFAVVLLGLGLAVGYLVYGYRGGFVRRRMHVWQLNRDLEGTEARFVGWVFIAGGVVWLIMTGALVVLWLHG